jgi:hypothetical protein
MKNLTALLALSVLALGTATISSCSPETGDSTPDPILKVDPATALSFVFDDKKVETINVEQNAAEYEVKVDEGKSWVVITKANDSFTVGVAEYSYEDAEAANFAARTANITVTAGKAYPVIIAVSQSAPRELVPSVALSTEALTFTAGGELTQTVTLTATDFTLSTVEVAKYAEWIKSATYANGVLTVTVDKYESLKLKADRACVVTLTLPELAAPVTVKVAQELNLLPLNIEGTWKVLSGFFVVPSNGARNQDSKTKLDYVVTLTITKNEDGSYKVGGFPVQPFAPKWKNDQLPVGIMLTVNEENKVIFTSRAPYGKVMVAEGYDPNWNDLYVEKDAICTLNYTHDNVANPSDPAGWIGKFFKNDVSNVDKYVAPAGTTIEIAVNEDGNMLTFPTNGTFEGEACKYSFGCAVVPGEDGKVSFVQYSMNDAILLRQ